MDMNVSSENPIKILALLVKAILLLISSGINQFNNANIFFISISEGKMPNSAISPGHISLKQQSPDAKRFSGLDDPVLYLVLPH